MYILNPLFRKARPKANSAMCALYGSIQWKRWNLAESRFIRTVSAATNVTHR